MGKKGGSNNGKKMNNVFKVAGAKSLKMKNKAKPVAAQLKKVITTQRAGLKLVEWMTNYHLVQQIKEDSRQTLNKIDADFSSLQDKIMQPNKQKAAEAARQANVFKGVREAEAERRDKASETQKIKEEIEKLADLMMS